MSTRPGHYGRVFALAATACLALGGCGAAPSARLDTAQGIAAAGMMARRDIAAAPFLLRSYERIDDPSGSSARIYIEGDGLAWLSANRPSPDPTPIHPLALALAQVDKSANVLYLARPCQYNTAHAGATCAARYWKSSRFAPEVIAAMNSAVDDMKQRHKLRRLQLIGYSGGGAVALLIAARRSDITSVITVAGNLDTAAFTRLHRVSAMPDSLNPADFAAQLSRTPQTHFVGGRDDVVPIEIYRNYRTRADKTARVDVRVVPGVGHADGWAEAWPALMAQADSKL